MLSSMFGCSQEAEMSKEALSRQFISHMHTARIAGPNSLSRYAHPILLEELSPSDLHRSAPIRTSYTLNRSASVPTSIAPTLSTSNHTYHHSPITPHSYREHTFASSLLRQKHLSVGFHRALRLQDQLDSAFLMRRLDEEDSEASGSICWRWRDGTNTWSSDSVSDSAQNRTESRPPVSVQQPPPQPHLSGSVCLPLWKQFPYPALIKHSDC